MGVVDAGFDQYGLRVPGWVPEPARRYIAHTELGVSIRQLARIGGCHPSTVLRQVRRIELQRDDPLVDRAVYMLATRTHSTTTKKERAPMASAQAEEAD